MIELTPMATYVRRISALRPKRAHPTFVFELFLPVKTIEDALNDNPSSEYLI